MGVQALLGKLHVYTKAMSPQILMLRPCTTDLGSCSRALLQMAWQVLHISYPCLIM